MQDNGQTKKPAFLKRGMRAGNQGRDEKLKLKRANARNPRAIIPSHNRGDKYLHEIHFYSFSAPP